MKILNLYILEYLLMTHKIYDFILIEPIYWCMAHYTSDLKNITEILKAAGYKIAVVNYIKNNKYHADKEYDVINIFPDYKFPDRHYIINEKNKIKRFFKKIILDYHRYKFFEEIYRQIKNLSDNFYFGTYTTDSFPLFFLKTKSKNIYYWGLRSFYFTQPHFAIKNNPYTELKAIVLRKKILKYKSIKFFISNKFIKEEFISGGLEPNRLIERPERTLNKLSNFKFDKLNKEFTLLTVGFIRKEKNLEFSIEVLKNQNVKFIIAGNSVSVYGKSLDEKIEEINASNIIRKKGFIPDNEYHNLFIQSHFILIADKKSKSTVSNGTFLEALLKGRPVIVPDQKPYNYYVDKYNIGLKFIPNDKKSLLDTVKKVKLLGCRNFEEALIKFQKEYLLDNVAEIVKRQLI